MNQRQESAITRSDDAACAPRIDPLKVVNDPERFSLRVCLECAPCSDGRGPTNLYTATIHAVDSTQKMASPIRQVSSQTEKLIAQNGGSGNTSNKEKNPKGKSPRPRSTVDWWERSQTQLDASLRTLDGTTEE
jgi:hypothetical protein